MIFNRPYRVVIIDDDDSTLELLKHDLSGLSKDDVTFSVFNDPKDAMSFIKNHQVHIVLTDMQLNSDDEDGADIISKCIGLEKGIQVIAMTQDVRLLTAIDCYNRGARYILTKPINNKKLLHTLSNLFTFLDEWHEVIKEKIHHEDEED